MKNPSIIKSAAGLLLCCLLAASPASVGLGMELPADMSAMMGGDSGMDNSTTVIDVTTYSTSAGRGSTSGSRTVYHSRSSVTTTTGYNALELTVDGAAAETLTVGGVTLDLTLTGADGATLRFMPGFARWNGDGAMAVALTEGEADNALAVTAEEESDGGLWRFSGQTLKKLRNSGIDWLVLENGESQIALPTGGFLGGLQYDRLKSAGTADSAFQYTVSVTAGALQITAAAADESWTVGGDPGDGLYHTGVYSNLSRGE